MTEPRPDYGANTTATLPGLVTAELVARDELVAPIRDEYAAASEIADILDELDADEARRVIIGLVHKYNVARVRIGG